MTVGTDENELIVYGGVRYSPKYEVLSDLWSFDIKNSKWSEIEIDESNGIKPIPNSGHSLVKVIFSNSTSILISIGGYSPKYGYISLVEEFKFLDSKKKFKFKSLLPMVPESMAHLVTWQLLTNQKARSIWFTFMVVMKIANYRTI